jgi:hypothetical protein
MKTNILIILSMFSFIAFTAHGNNEKTQTKVKKQIPPGLIKTDYPDVFLTQNQFSNFIARQIDHISWRNRTQKYAVPGIFDETNKLHIYEIFDVLIDKVTVRPSVPRRSEYKMALDQLRCRSLIPYITTKLLNEDFTTNAHKGSYMHAYLSNLPHVDTLKVWLYLNDNVPETSPLKNKKYDIWHSSLPVFINTNCMNFYIDIVNSPDKYTYTRWYDAVEKLDNFTNEIAVAALQFALRVIDQPQKYWPEERRSEFRTIGLENMLRYQNEMKTGKRNARKPSPKLLDKIE